MKGFGGRLFDALDNDYKGVITFSKIFQFLWNLRVSFYSAM